MAGKVEDLLIRKAQNGTLLFALIDSEGSDTKQAAATAKAVEEMGAAAVLVGGSSATNQFELAEIVDSIKKVITIPIVLFPGNITGVAPGADAILFSSLLNSENPYYITQAQALGAPNILKFGLEPLPTAYIVIGEGTTAWFVGSVKGIPHNKPKIAAAYALAAQCMGMRFVYLEAGSGAEQAVPPEMVRMVRKIFDGFLIVGGGIRDAHTAAQISQAGADALVVGTMLENVGGIQKLADVVKNIS